MGELGSWNAKNFAELAEQVKATLVSLVPSQVFDLVAQSLIAPSSLRAIVVGGGALTADLYAAARNLGWPVLPSYGLTECGSQVATASPIEQNKKSGSGFDLPPVFLLPHVRVESDGILPLKIQSPSLLTGLVNLDEGDGIFVDPKIDGWFETEDFATVQLVAGRPALLLQGRGPDFVKIGGESVSLSQLEAKLESVRIEINYSWDVALVAVDDSRLGSVIRLLAAPAPAAARQQLLDAYAARVLPYERIRKVVEVEQIPRSSLRKLLRLEAKRLAGTSS
jgi:O-succinylbenzoic acid--CoA ligase